MSSPPLHIRNISLRPAPEAGPVCLDTEIPGGSSVVLRGPSGIGKTTLLRAVARLRPVDEGDVFLGGQSWRDVSPREWRRRVAYVISKPGFTSGTVWENLELPFRLRIAGDDAFPEDRARELARRLLLPDNLLERETRVLSDGERVRVGLLRALLLSPAALLADEPTGPLDPESRAAVSDLLTEEMQENGLSMLLVSHDEHLAERLGAHVIRIERSRP